MRISTVTPTHYCEITCPRKNSTPFRPKTCRSVSNFRVDLLFPDVFTGVNYRGTCLPPPLPVRHGMAPESHLSPARCWPHAAALIGWPSLDRRAAAPAAVPHLDPLITLVQRQNTTKKGAAHCVMTSSRASARISRPCCATYYSRTNHYAFILATYFWSCFSL